MGEGLVESFPSKIISLPQSRHPTECTPPGSLIDVVEKDTDTSGDVDEAACLEGEFAGVLINSENGNRV